MGPLTLFQGGQMDISHYPDLLAWATDRGERAI